MEKSQERQAAKVRLVAAMQRGLSQQEALQETGLRMSRSTVFRLRRRVHLMGAEAAQDGRHGHPAKLRGEVREFLEKTCRQAPHTPSHQIQTLLTEQFSLTISVSQINRTRTALGVSNPPQGAKKTERSER
jgi:transposase